jgi:hypothetical protein
MYKEITTKNKPVSIQFSKDNNTENQAFGKCKTLFLVESYRFLLTLNKPLTDSIVDKMETDCECLASRAIRDNRGLELNIEPVEPVYEEIEPVKEDVKSNNGFTPEYLNKIFQKHGHNINAPEPLTPKQSELIIRLAEKHYSKNDSMRSKYLDNLGSLSKIEASARIGELLRAN